MSKFKKAIVIGTFFSCASLFLHASEEAPDVKTSQGYVLQEHEILLLDAILKNEQQCFIDGGDCFLFGKKIPYIQAQDVAKAYDENQVAADQKYFNKNLQVNGVIVSINSGLGNTPYVLLKGINQFLSPQVHFVEGNIDKIASLKKGQTVSFLCTGGGSVAGTPMFKGCIFAEDYSLSKINEVKVKVKSWLEGGEPKSDIVPKLSIMAISVARSLPKNSSCFTKSDSCISEMEKLKDPKELFIQVAMELKSKGIQVPDSLTNK